MACSRCGQGNTARNQVPPVPRVLPPTPAVSKIKQTPKGPLPKPKQRKFCSCGWMMGRTRYVDVRTNKWVEKYSCPNNKCSHYNK